jgi:diacylglycerol kinase
MTMNNFLRSRAISFRHAFAGLWYVLKTQRNSWIHGLATLCVILLAAWLHLSLQDWAILIVTVAVVWTAECFNSALEAAVDLLSPDLHPLAKISKDAGAGGVLISAIFSIIIGLLILGPPLVERFSQLALPH